jgi:hypothetical protein
MLTRGLAVDTIKGRCGVVSRFVEFTNEYPWRWRPLDVDQFLAGLRSQDSPIALSTLRSYSNAISMFCSYVSDSRDGWVTFCEKQFGDAPTTPPSLSPCHQRFVTVTNRLAAHGLLKPRYFCLEPLPPRQLA